MRKKKPNEPLFVAISDLHFSVTNLSLCSYALTCAVAKAEELKIPLVIAGDLNDTKAIIRAEVANELIHILKDSKTDIYILVGNHDLINEKGEGHCLNFLAPYANIIDTPERILDGVSAIPYQSDVEKLKIILKGTAPGEIIVMHQGVNGANMGDYVIDKTSISTDELAPFTCISGHYHRHQTVGTLTYIGSPFTMSFGEANDGPKGFLVVASDGSFTREILDLRKHVIVDAWCNDDDGISLINYGFTAEDLVWVKLTGSKSMLDKITKQYVATVLGWDNFKLDKIPTDTINAEINRTILRTGEQILDQLIDQTKESDAQKKALKVLWRESI